MWHRLAWVGSSVGWQGKRLVYRSLWTGWFHRQIVSEGGRVIARATIRDQDCVLAPSLMKGSIFPLGPAPATSTRWIQHLPLAPVQPGRAACVVTAASFSLWCATIVIVLVPVHYFVYGCHKKSRLLLSFTLSLTTTASPPALLEISLIRSISVVPFIDIDSFWVKKINKLVLFHGVIQKWRGNTGSWVRGKC